MASDRPLMFSKVDHVLDTTESYRVASGTLYYIQIINDCLLIDSSGSLYILVGSNSSSSFVIKVNAIGDLSATIAEITATGVSFDPWGLTEYSSGLVVGVYANASSVLDVGLIAMDTATLN